MSFPAQTHEQQFKFEKHFSQISSFSTESYDDRIDKQLKSKTVLRWILKYFALQFLQFLSSRTSFNPIHWNISGNVSWYVDSISYLRWNYLTFLVTSKPNNWYGNYWFLRIFEEKSRSQVCAVELLEGSILKILRHFNKKALQENLEKGCIFCNLQETSKIPCIWRYQRMLL